MITLNDQQLQALSKYVGSIPTDYGVWFIDFFRAVRAENEAAENEAKAAEQAKISSMKIDEAATDSPQ
jgi:hypothetical protein